MKVLRKHLLVLIGWFAVLTMGAQSHYDFEENGIFYKIISVDKMEVEIVKESIDQDNYGNNYVVASTYSGDFVVPETVSFKGRSFNVAQIGEYAFYESDITSIDFGKVKRIGSSAFRLCNRLKSIDFKNVESMAYGAFDDCRNLSNVDFKNVRSIGDFAFYDCSSLVSLDLKNVETLGTRVFENCSNLTSVRFGKTKRLDALFQYCRNLKEVDLTNVVEIGDATFHDCVALEQIDLKNVEKIARYAFDNCKNLRSIDLKNVRTLGAEAFKGCTSLTSVDLKNVQNIEIWDNDYFLGAFANCTNLTTVDLRNLKTLGYRTFQGCKKVELIKTNETTPPVVQDDSFDQMMFFSSTLQVPAGCKSVYATTPIWNNFLTIVESADEQQVPLTVSCNAGGRVDFASYSVSNSSASEMFVLGEKVKMTVTADEGYRLKSVFVNDKEVTAAMEGQSYTFEMNAKTVVTVTFEKLPVYLTVQHADNGQISQLVERETAYTFLIRVSEGWKINTVTFNGLDVTGELDEENKYTTPVITKNSMLCVSLELDVPTAVHEWSAEKISVHGDNGELLIEGASRGELIKVYSLDGAMVASEVSKGASQCFSLEKNKIYIVKVGQRTFKLSL